MIRAEQKCRKFLIDHFVWIAMLAVLAAGVIVRWSLIPFISGDFDHFNVPWLNEMRRIGGNTMVEDGRFNYSPLFFYLFKVVGDLFPTVRAELLCKAMSILPECLLSLLCIVILDRMVRPSGQKPGVASLIICIAFWLHPLLILNGAAWGQTDCYYVLFSLLSVWLMIKDRPVWAIAALGVSCSWKLQGIFLLPMVILLYLCGSKRFSILWLLLIPAVMTVTSLPMGLIKLDPLQIFRIYLAQAGEHQKLTLNYPNLYALVESGTAGYSALAPLGVGLLAAAFCAAAACFVRKGTVLQGKRLLLVGAWCVLMCTYLLPCMHDRYALAGEVLLLAYAIVSRNKESCLAAVLCTLATLNAYTNYLASPLFPAGVAMAMQTAAVLLISREVWRMSSFAGISE